MKISLSRIGLAFGFVAALTATGYAQQTGTPSAPNAGAQQQEQPGMGRHRRGMRGGRHRGGHMQMRALHQLNLTDQQREQVRGLMTRHAESTRAQRAELRRLRAQARSGNAEAETRARAFREELRRSSEQLHTELTTILTAEQRTQLEQLRQQHRQMGEGRRERGERGMRGGFGGLNLTEAQQQQIAQIRQRYAADLQSRREAMRAEIQAVLTPEQRAQLEQRRAEHRARRGERGERFRGRRPGQPPTTPGNTQP